MEFQVDTKWDGKLGGLIETEWGYSLEFDIPTTFGGPGKAFCPDELFVASVAGCLMNTFLHFRERLELEMEAFSLLARVEVEFERGRYQITKLQVEGTLIVRTGNEERGEECLRLAKDYCHISRALASCVPIEYQIRIESTPE